MKKRFMAAMTFVLAVIGNVNAQDYRIERAEPPSWWTGMVEPQVQLMFYGPRISELTPVIDHDGVYIIGLHRPPNPNYLFVDVHIEKSAQSGEVPIEFRLEGESVLTHKYPLYERRDGSASRAGFGNSDVLYLVTPDRFANGDYSNDEIDGMKEGLDRSEPYGRHGGDLRGLIDHLDYIQDLGFTAIWLNPVLENDQPESSYHGYATTDYYKVDPRLGTNEEYLELSRKAAEADVGIIMDIIVNHCGHHHWWMDDLPFPDWINYQQEGYTATNHLKTTLVDPHVAPGDRDRMTKGWFVSQMPDLNQRNPFMSTYLIQNSIWWVEYADLYGLRQDTYSYPFKQFMSDWTCALRREYPNLTIVGEEWTDEQAIVSYWQEGKVNHDGYTSCLSSLMDFPLTFSLHKGLLEEDHFGRGLYRMYETLAMDFLYPDPDQLVVFPDNHDMSRILTQLEEDTALTKIALAYILTTRGTPQIFYGTEILMSNPGTDSHGVIRSDYPGGWTSDTINAFTGTGMAEDRLAFRDWMKHLLTWRQGASALHGGKMMHYSPLDGTYVYFRYNDAQKIMVTINKNMESVTLPLDRFDILEGHASAIDIESGQRIGLNGSLQVPAKHALILEIE